MGEGKIVPLKGSIKITVGAMINALLRQAYPNMVWWKKPLVKLYFTLDKIKNRRIKW